MSPPVRLPENEPNGSAIDPPAPRWLRWLIYSAERFGVATVILICVGWWFASRIAEPLVQSHIDFLKIEQKNTSELGEAQKQAGKNLEIIAGTQRDLLTAQKDVASTLVAAQRDVATTLVSAQREAAANQARNSDAIIASQGKIIEAVGEQIKQAGKQTETLDRMSKATERADLAHEEHKKKLDEIDVKLKPK